MRTFKITGQLAAFFSSDEISASMVKSTYDAFTNVIENPEKFPKADFDACNFVVNALFELSPTAAMEGN